MIQKKLSKILFFIGLAKVVRALICVSHATEILDETNSKNPILVHNTQIPINSIEGTIDYITVPAGTSLTEIPHQISQARKSKGLSPHIHLNQQDEFLNHPWYINDDIFVESPLPSKITKIASQKGQKVTRGQKLYTIEAMKMKCLITSPIDGEVIDILVKVGDQVGIEPIIKLRPLELKSLNLRNIPNNQQILSALFPWEISSTNTLPTGDLITALSEGTEKKTEPSQPASVPQTISPEPTIVTNDQPLKPSLPLNFVEENLTPILSKNNSVPFKNLEITEQPTLLPLLSKPQQEINSKLPEKITPPFPATEEQIALSPLVSAPQTTIAGSTIVTKMHPFKSFLPNIMAKEILAPILLKNNDDTLSHNRYVHVQPTLLPLVSQPQANVNLAFPEKKAPSPAVDEKQIVLSTPDSVPQTISTESTIVTNDPPFKTSLFIDSAKEGKGHTSQSTGITVSDAPIKFLSQKQDKIKFKLFTNTHKKLYLLLVLYCFALASEKFRAHFRRRAIFLKTTDFKRFIPIFYKPAHNQNFSLSKCIKLA